MASGNQPNIYFNPQKLEVLARKVQTENENIAMRNITAELEEFTLPASACPKHQPATENKSDNLRAFRLAIIIEISNPDDTLSPRACRLQAAIERTNLPLFVHQWKDAENLDDIVQSLRTRYLQYCNYVFVTLIFHTIDETKSINYSHFPSIDGVLEIFQRNMDDSVPLILTVSFKSVIDDAKPESVELKRKYTTLLLEEDCGSVIIQGYITAMATEIATSGGAVTFYEMHENAVRKIIAENESIARCSVVQCR